MSNIEEIERAVDNLSPPKASKPKMKLGKTTKVGLAVLIASLMVIGAYAGLLPYFGEVRTTINAQASILVGEKVGDSIVWKAWNEQIIRSIDPAVHCNDYCFKAWIENQACEDVLLNIVDTGITAPGNPMNFTGVTINHHVFGDSQTVHLVQKNVVFGQSPWTILQGGAHADVTFNTCGEEMDYTITYSGLETGISYSLVYYMNAPDYWTDGPVTILGTFIANGGTASGSSDVATLPFVDDENAQRPISVVGETYVHQYGAKIWIVPTLAITQGNDVDWAQASVFLFETDLIFYLDCDNMSPVCLPHVYPIFETHIAKQGETYCWITCYHLDLNIIPGVYQFSTKVYASSVPS